MKITPTQQRPGIPADAPKVIDPVLVDLDIPVYYVSERGPVLSGSPIFCSHEFAACVLGPMDEILRGSGWGLAHVGIYNPRKARMATGKIIKPERWSNHAYGEAMDFKGLVTSTHQVLGISQLRQRHDTLLTNLLAACTANIKQAHRRPEIVDEGGWIHLGIWPVAP